MKEKKSYDFTKKLLTLVFPIAFQQFMLALVSASDALMLGMLTQDSLSAVSLASQVTFVENLFLMAMTIGLSMFAAQYWGKGDKVAVERIFAYVMKVTAAVSFLFFLAGMCVPGSLMRVFTNELPLIEGGRVYLRTVSPAFLLTGISQVYLCILKNTGKAAKSSVISSVSVVVNIILNAIFIFGHLGSDAVAANSIANIVKNLVVCFCLGSGGGIMVGNELGAGRLDKAKEYGGRLCRMSVLCGVSSGIVMCSCYMFGKSVNGTTIGGIFYAGGDSRFSILCDTVTM